MHELNNKLGPRINVVEFQHCLLIPHKIPGVVKHPFIYLTP